MCLFQVFLKINCKLLLLKTKAKNKIKTSSLCDNYIVFQKEKLSNLPTSYIYHSFFIGDFKFFFSLKKNQLQYMKEKVYRRHLHGVCMHFNTLTEKLLQLLLNLFNYDHQFVGVCSFKRKPEQMLHYILIARPLTML